MTQTSTPPEGKTRSLFLSYSRKDRGFVRDLTRDLRIAGVSVSLDELEGIRVGDSLLEKLSEAIRRHDYLGVVLTPDSVSSRWVQDELAWARDREAANNQVFLLPLLLRSCEVPDFLRDRLYADFTEHARYRAALLDLLVRLGVDAVAFAPKVHPLLKALDEEVTSGGVYDATIEAVIESSISPPLLEAFLEALVRRAEGDSLGGLVILCIGLLDRHDICHDAILEGILSDKLPEYFLPSFSWYLANCKSEPAVMWCHRVHIEGIRRDAFYQTFVARHADLLVRRCYDDLASYLLIPDRGPSYYNIDTFLDVITASDRPGPFVTRWIDWIKSGRFDGPKTETYESAQVLYLCLDSGLEACPDKFRPIADEVLLYTRSLLKSRNDTQQRRGRQHLVDMLWVNSTLASRVVNEVLNRVYIDDMPTTAHALALRAFSALADMHQRESLSGRLVAKREPDARLKDLLRDARDALTALGAFG